MDLLSDAIALGENGGLLRRIPSRFMPMRERDLLRQRHEELRDFRSQRLMVPETEADEADVAIAEHQRQQIEALVCRRLRW